MSEIVHASAASPFDGLMGEDGRWSARDLMKQMNYSTWQKFQVPLERAMATARNQGHDVGSEFSQVTRPNRSVNPASAPMNDYRLSRFASYLLAMNGDPNKDEVAAAQAYFAVSTREAEINRSKSALELLRDQVDMAIAHERKMKELDSRQTVTEAKVEAIEGRYDWFAALGYAKLHNHPTDRKYLSRVGKKASQLMRVQGREPVKRQDATFGEINTYPAEILREAFLTVNRSEEG